MMNIEDQMEELRLQLIDVVKEQEFNLQHPLCYCYESNAWYFDQTLSLKNTGGQWITSPTSSNNIRVKKFKI